MTKRFADRLILITGAAGGLGRALAQGYAREGGRLILTDMNEKGLEETKSIVGAGSVVSLHLLDLAVESDTIAFGKKICAAHEKLDVLYNNAGIAYNAEAFGFENLTQAQWFHIFAVNSLAPLILGQALRPALKNAKGVIINQSSMASYSPAVAYGVTKAAVNSFTYGMAHRFGADGIRVNAIAPGIMETPASKATLPEARYKEIQQLQLLNLHGTADDIVNLALFLSSDDARFITCEVVHCDAGNKLRPWRD